MKRNFRITAISLAIALITFLFLGESFGSGSGSGGAVHTDPFSFILIEVALIILGALLGRWVAIRVKQPAVLGELLFGVVIGNLGYWLNIPQFVLVMRMESMNEIFSAVWGSGLALTEVASDIFSPSELASGGIGEKILGILTGPDGSRYVITTFALWVFSNLGVILLLFMVGLESSVDEMLRVGPRALAVAVIGVVVPFLLGIGFTYAIMPDLSTSAHLFLAATLCATSVGITARVFQDLNRIQTPEARIILGAAVIDDVLGLIVLAVVAGIVTTGVVQVGNVGRILVLSLVFLGGVIFFGERVLRWTIPIITRLDRRHSKLLFPLFLAFVFSWLASQIELATIVGAFAAGLILYEGLFEKHAEGNVTMEEMFRPLETIFAPIFFVLMGMQVDLASFAQKETFWFAIGFIVVAIIGKVVAGIPAGKNIDRLSVGFGMIPRGEVGLIFASIGKSLGVVSGPIFSALVMMVIVTTLITPLLLRWSLFRTPPTSGQAASPEAQQMLPKEPA